MPSNKEELEEQARLKLQQSQNSKNQDQQSADENDPTWNRIKGLGKMGVGYLSALVYFGTPVGQALAIGGAGLSIIGFGIKKISQAFGWKEGEEFGANMTKYSLRVLAAPLYSVGAFLDGGYNLLSGNQSNPGCVGYLDKTTSYLSGADKLEGQSFGNQLIEKDSPDKTSLDKQEQEKQKQKTKDAAGNPIEQLDSKQPVNISSPSQKQKKELKTSSYSAPTITNNNKTPSSPRSVTEREGEEQESSISIDLISEMKKAKSLKEAQRVYSNNIDSKKAFEMVGEPIPNEKGGVTITWKPPGAAGNQDLYVTLTYDKDKNVIDQKIGNKATAILPPVKNLDGSYSIYSCQDGKEVKVSKPDIEATFRRQRNSGATLFSQSLPNNKQVGSVRLHD